MERQNWKIPRKWVKPEHYYQSIDEWGIAKETGLECSITLDDTSDFQFLVLLGHPFAGKSYAAEAYAKDLKSTGEKVLLLRGLGDLHSDTLLIHNWFNNEDWRDFCADGSKLTVIIDGWDEVKSAFPSISDVIVGQIRRSMEQNPQLRQRLRLRIFSRHSGWTSSEDRKFLNLFLDEETRISLVNLWLLPLNRSEITSIVEEAGANAPDFFHRTRLDKTQTLLATAGNISWLIDTYLSQGHLPNTQAAIFDAVTMRLVEDQERVDAATALGLRSLSERIALVTAVTSNPIINNAAISSQEPYYTSLLSVCGGVEGSSGVEVKGTFENFSQCLHSGLFTKVEDHTFIWSHQSYQEFLAGKYLGSLDMPTWQKVEILTNPLEEQRRIYPRLMVAAGWACNFDEQLMDYFIQHDPESLIRSGIVFDSSLRRAQLIESFLQKLDDRSLTPTSWYSKEIFAIQHVTEIEAIANEFLADHGRNWNARQIAIQVADAMEFTSLADVACKIALDESENINLRITAAYFVGDHGDDESKARLATLAKLDPSLDDNFELRGCALRACYPQHVPLVDLLAGFVVPPSSFFGAYRSFIDQDLVSRTTSSDLPTLINWWKTQVKWPRADIYASTFQATLVVRSLSEIDDDRVLIALAGFMAQEASELLSHFQYNWPMDSYKKTITEKEIRRKFLHEYVIAYQGRQSIHDTLWNAYGGSLGMLVQDIDWIEQELREYIPDGDGPQWIRFLASMPEIMALELLWERKDRIEELGLTTSILGPIELKSKAAESMKYNRDLFYRNDEDSQETEDDNGLNEQVTHYLLLGETGDPRWWHYADQVVQSGGGTRGFSIDNGTPSSRRMRHWAKLSSNNQDRLIKLSPAFIQAAIVDQEDINLHWSLEAIALVRAVGLLVETDKFDLLTLTPNDYKRIGPAFLAFSLNYEHKDSTLLRDILMLCRNNGFDISMRLKDIAYRTTVANESLLEHSIHNARSLLESSEIQTLASDLIQNKCGSRALIRLALGLHDRMSDQTFAAILDSLDSEDCYSISLVISAALTEGTDSTWTTVRPFLLDHPERVEALFGVHHRAGGTTDSFSENLPAESLVELFRLAVQALPPSTDPQSEEAHTVGPRESAGHLRDNLLSQIQRLGSWEAVVALEGIRSEIEYEVTWIGTAIARAKERARSFTEVAITVDEVMTLVLSPQKPVIRSESALLNAICEQLKLLEIRLRDASRLSSGFWNQRGTVEPKDERDMVAFLRSLLVDQLDPLGITLDLETENRPRDKPDLMFQYASSATGEIIRVPGEAKPCFNDQIFSAMTNQLFERYMVAQGHSHGVYLSLWMECSSWNRHSRSRRHRRKHSDSLEDFRSEMGRIAEDISSSTHIVASYVLDCSLADAGRRTND